MTAAPPESGAAACPDFPIPAPLSDPAVTLLSMDDDVVFMVRGRTREVCQRYLDLVCKLLGAEQASHPSDGTGRGWVARAVLRTPATPADAEPRA
jgi:hypothetical protein